MFLPSRSTRTKAYKHYPKPRLSALTLAQYCIARNAKERALQAYLGDIRRDRSTLTKTHAALTTRAQSPLMSDFQRETALRNLENLNRFGEHEQVLALGGYGFERAPQDQDDLIIKGVPVSIQLDWFVTAPNETK
jgi:hypothetical protein